MLRRSLAVCLMERLLLVLSLVVPAGSGRGARGCFLSTADVDEPPDRSSPPAETLPARETGRPRDVLHRGLLHVPKVEQVSVPLLEVLHPPAQFGSLVQGVQDLRLEALRSLAAFGSADLQDRGRARLPPVRVGDET